MFEMRYMHYPMFSISGLFTNWFSLSMRLSLHYTIQLYLLVVCIQPLHIDLVLLKLCSVPGIL